VFLSVSSLFLYSCDLFITCPDKTSYEGKSACEEYCGYCEGKRYTEVLGGQIVKDECHCY